MAHSDDDDDDDDDDDELEVAESLKWVGTGWTSEGKYSTGGGMCSSPQRPYHLGELPSATFLVDTRSFIFQEQSDRSVELTPQIYFRD